MSKKHQKKRNASLLYEFLVRCISTSLVENNKKKSTLALKILRKHFKPGTELFKEFRLINSLVKTTVSSASVASSILFEAKAAARSHDAVKLDREKSILIKHINHSLNDDGCFYDAQVGEYKKYATVQSLVNDWRAQTPDLFRMGQYENSLVQLMTEEKTIYEQPVLDESAGTTRLLMKVMTEKLNEKYAGALTNDQKSLVKAYAFSSINDDMNTVRLKLSEVRDSLVGDIDSFVAASTDVIVSEKLESTKKKLIAENIDVIDDSLVSRFMLYVQLRDELVSE